MVATCQSSPGLKRFPASFALRSVGQLSFWFSGLLSPACSGVPGVLLRLEVPLASVHSYMRG